MAAAGSWRVRDFHDDDLDAAVRLWDSPASSGEAPAFGLSDLIAAVRSHEPAVVAVVGEELAGTAVATLSGGRAWIMRISLAPAWRRRGIGSAMLGELERRLVAAGVQGVTNEMLKLIPPFREQDERLLICATNSVRALDGAFLRHGRFDYVIPVGPPDPAAREAIWDRYLASIPHRDLEMAAIVAGSRLFTPADIEFAARRTAQLAFERVLFDRGEEEVTTADVLQGIAETRRTLTAELVAEFEQDIQSCARV